MKKSKPKTKVASKSITWATKQRDSKLHRPGGGRNLWRGLRGAPCPFLARLGSPAARNRGPLFPQLRTFLWSSLTSGCDPQETLALPNEAEHSSLTTRRERLVKIGAKVVRHGRYVTFQLAEVAVPKELFRKILSLIDDLRRRPVPA